MAWKKRGLPYLLALITINKTATGEARELLTQGGVLCAGKISGGESITAGTVEV
jgi:hypothetical protein